MGRVVEVYVGPSRVYNTWVAPAAASSCVPLPAAGVRLGGGDVGLTPHSQPAPPPADPASGYGRGRSQGLAGGKVVGARGTPLPDSLTPSLTPESGEAPEAEGFVVVD